MTETLSSESFLPALRLSSGRACNIATPFVPGLCGYHVLSVQAPEPPPLPSELDELAVLAHAVGRALAQRRFGDPECYSVIFNAGRTRRHPWPHYHLLLADSVYAKRRAFTLLQLKHVLRWFWPKPQVVAGRAPC